MKTYLECIPCIINQGINVSNRLGVADDMREKVVREILKYLGTAKYDENPPQLAKDVYKIINTNLNTKDPFEDLKKYYNKEILKLEEKLYDQIISSKEQYQVAIKLAIAGNIIDFGAKHDLDEDTIFKHINDVEDKSMIIDSSGKLYEKLKKAKTVLYIGDNCGEIVFDKVLIRYIKKMFPEIKIYFGVRGEPIINDVTMVDAIDVEMDKIAEIISNGDSAPGTIIKCISQEFKDIFYSSDLVIAKGQGNYETLSTINRSDVYMLFMVKCSIVANELNVPQMSLVCLER